MKKVFRLLLACCIACTVFIQPVAADDYNFEQNEDYYYSLCSKSGLTSDQKKACKAFQEYLQGKADAVQDEIDEYNKKINDIKKDINKVLQVIREYDKKIASIESQQKKLEERINTLEANINALQVEIDARIANIEALDKQIKERMVNIQSFVSLDQYIEFIMGASDFVDLLRRTSAINDIMDYDTNQIKKLEEEKATLAQNQAELEEQKEGLDKERAALVKTKKSLKTARADQEELKNYYLSQKTKLESEKRKNVNDLDDLLDALDDISKALGAVVPSAGWILPIKTGWYISAGAFYYPASFGGGVHLGVDFAASSSRKIRAVANGVILYVYDRCGSGYYGNACGGVWGGGNMVVYAVSVGSKTYGVQLCHMSRGVSKYVKAGDIVTQGTTLGYVGTSGNSTGNHLHIELYDLGKKSLATVAKEFSKKGDVTFGTGWYSLSTTCDNKKTTPCRLNPQKIFNVKVGQSG